MRVNLSNANDMKLFLMIFPRISLHCMLVPVQNREYETGLLSQCNNKNLFFSDPPGPIDNSNILFTKGNTKVLRTSEYFEEL